MKKPIKNLVVITGAGISAESGIQRFRDQDGIWERYPMDLIATPQGFHAHPDKVYGFYNLARSWLQSEAVSPNAAHSSLADLQKRWVAGGGNFTLITQNVDDLHQRAGHQSVLSMHGELLSARCQQTGQTQPWLGDLLPHHRCRCCTPPVALRPNIVWFDEDPLHMQSCWTAVQEADLLVSIGTSGAVYPAAGFLDIASQLGRMTLELNLKPTSPKVFAGIYGPATQTVPLLSENLYPLMPMQVLSDWIETKIVS